MVVRPADRWRIRYTLGEMWQLAPTAQASGHPSHITTTLWLLPNMDKKLWASYPRWADCNFESSGKPHFSTLTAWEPRKCSILSSSRESVRNQRQIICSPPLPSDPFLPSRLLFIFQVNQVGNWWKPFREATWLLFLECSWVTLSKALIKES